MTIAVCYLSPEGVVFGADSTTTFSATSGHHFFNHAQKLFEVGSDSTLGLVTWGLAGLEDVSYRTLVARLADSLRGAPPADVRDVADRWIAEVWPVFSSMTAYARVNDLHRNANRNAQEDEEYHQLCTGLVAGFCLGGYCLPDRVSKAFEIVFDPLAPRPTPSEVAKNSHRWWGVPNIISRLIFGSDQNLRQAVLSSGHWSGTPAEFDKIVAEQALEHPILPIREAVDFVHSCIRSTGKAMKFSNFPQVCGGAPEIAVITSDRSFRWVRHKTWDTAIEDGG